MRPWTEQLADRLAFELAEFSRRGLDFQPDERELAQRKRLVLHGHVEHAGSTVPVTVVYPDSFPYLRPEVFAPELALGRHQNPFDGNLCLLDRSSREWNTTDTGAWLIAERLPLLLDLLARGGEDLRAGEAPQGEPVTSYLATNNGAMLLVCEQALRVEEGVSAGTLRLGLGMAVPVSGQLRAALLSVSGERDGAGKPWRSDAPDEQLAARFSTSALTAPWVRLDALPGSRDPEVLVHAAHRVRPQAADPRWMPAQDGQLALLGLLVPEEVRQGETEESWVLVVRRRPPRGIPHPGEAYVLRGERFSAAALQERTPAMRAMREKTVSVAGLGTLGAPSAMELARAQVGELRLLDPDMVEAGNTVRWPFGVTAVGTSKALFLANQVQLEYPFTRARAVVHRIGETAPQWPAGARSEASVLTEFLAGSELLLDATGELGVSQLLADLATEAGMPMLSIWGTEGGWGGAVAELHAGGGGCWFCLQLHLADGSIPAPPAEPSSNVQPRGCAAPTFTATSFDMLPIVAQTMRCARRVLLEPPGGSVVHVCATRLDDGREAPAPLWSSHTLEAHPACQCCNAAVAA